MTLQDLLGAALSAGGIGGFLAVVVMYYAHRDYRRHEKEQSLMHSQMMHVVANNTEALTRMEITLRERLPRGFVLSKRRDEDAMVS